MTGPDPDLSIAVTHLMKGVLYRDMHEVAWRSLVQLQPKVRDYVGVIGLTVVVDEARGTRSCARGPIWRPRTRMPSPFRGWSRAGRCRSR
jgi:hypothetical protein